MSGHFANFKGQGIPRRVCYTQRLLLVHMSPDQGPAPACADAGDVNDDGVLNLKDPLWLLVFLFLDGPPPPSPFPGLGPDPTPDMLGCGG